MLNLKDNRIINSRQAGIMMPLFFMRSHDDWGCGDFSSLKQWISYFKQYGVKIIQILPLHEMAAGEICPYAALSAYAIDPIYLSLADIEDVQNSSSARALMQQFGEDVASWRAHSRVQYRPIKDAKYKVLWAAYRQFTMTQKLNNTARWREFLIFQKTEGHWLAPYCIFRAAKDKTDWASWKSWDASLKDAKIEDIKSFAAANAGQMMFFSYIQWQAQLQLKAARSAAAQEGILLFEEIVPITTGHRCANNISHASLSPDKACWRIMAESSKYFTGIFIQ